MADASTTTTLAASESVDLEALPTRLQAIAATLGWMYFVEGFSKAEIARFYEKSRPWVSARIRELEEALRDQISEQRLAA